MPNTIVPAIQQRLRADADSICFKCFHRKVCRAIDNQPCIECNQFTDVNGVTVQKWIPVTERLPEPMVDVLCWYEYFRFGDYNRMYQTYGIGHYFRDGFWGGEVSNGQKCKVLAWMPLPEAPKGE